jgi:hypothetical protein
MGKKRASLTYRLKRVREVLELRENPCLWREPWARELRLELVLEPNAPLLVKGLRMGWECSWPTD